MPKKNVKQILSLKKNEQCLCNNKKGIVNNPIEFTRRCREQPPPRCLTSEVSRRERVLNSIQDLLYRTERIKEIGKQFAEVELKNKKDQRMVGFQFIFLFS